MAEVSKESEKKLSQLQMLEQSMQNLLMQKQQFQLQQVEIESALKELENVDEAYKIVGNIMVLSKKDDLKKDLSSKKEVMELRIKNMENNAPIIVGLDIGTTKVSVMIGRKDQFDKLEILGMGKAISGGVLRGIVANIDKTVESIKLAVEEA